MKINGKPIPLQLHKNHFIQPFFLIKAQVDKISIDKDSPTILMK